MELHSDVRWHIRKYVQQPHPHAHPTRPEGLTKWAVHTAHLAAAKRIQPHCLKRASL